MSIFKGFQKMVNGRKRRGVSFGILIFIGSLFVLGMLGVSTLATWAQITDSDYLPLILILPSDARISDWAVVEDDGTGPLITNISARFTNSQTINISWQTDIPTTGVVEYLTDAWYQAATVDDSYPFPDYKEDNVSSTSHTVTVSGLDPSATYYYYRIRAINETVDNYFESISHLNTVSSPFPFITSFTATPSSVASGQTAKLSWNSAHTTGCIISSSVSDSGAFSFLGNFNSSGSFTTAPLSTTTRFTLNCVAPRSDNLMSLASRTRFAFTTVTVIPSPSITSFTATPSSVASGQAATLSWNSINTTGCFITPSAAGSATYDTYLNLNSSGSLTTGPLATTTYFLLNCTAPRSDVFWTLTQRTRFASTTVVVVPLSSVPTITIVSPRNYGPYTLGSSLTITWTTTGSVPAVTINLYSSHGMKLSTIASNISNTGSYTWVIPTSLSEGRYRVRISSASDPAVYAQTVNIDLEASSNPSPPAALTVNSGQAANLAFQVPTGTTKALLFLSCPSGVSITLYGSGADTCNQWIQPAFQPNTTLTIPFSAINQTVSPVQITSNFLVYYSDQNYGHGVAGSIIVNPASN